MMEDQSVQATGQTHQEILPLTFILLIVVVALLVPLATAAPIKLERGERPTPAPVQVSAEDLPALGDLALNAQYEDISGIAISYPDGWVITPIQEGSFMLTNYPVPIEGDLPVDFVGLQIDMLPLADFTIMPDGSAPSSGTPVHEMAVTLVELVLGSPDAATVTDLTVSGLPAARFPITTTSGDFGTGELVLITPDDATIAIIQASTTPENESHLAPFIDNILKSITFTSAG